MVNRKRTQTLNLKKARKRQKISSTLMTSLLVAGTLIPVTTAFADSADQSTTPKTAQTGTQESQYPDSSDSQKKISFTVHYIDENGSELIPSHTYTGYEGQKDYIEPPYQIRYSEHTQETYVLNKTQAVTGFNGRSVSITYSKNVTDMTFQYKPRTYFIGSNGFWYAEDLGESVPKSYFVDLNFTFTDKETGEVLATYTLDKYYYNIEGGFSVDLNDVGIDTTKYGISLASQTHITHVRNPIIVNGSQTEYYSLFNLSRRDVYTPDGESQFFNDGAGKMNLTIPLDRVYNTPTPPTIIDEENRPILEQTITDAKPYLNKDKYQAKYVDALDKAIKAGEKALADNPVPKLRARRATTGVGAVFQANIDAINTALADVKANPIKAEPSKPDPEQQEVTIDINWVDQDGHTLKEPAQIKGKKGDKYDLSKYVVEIEGHKLDKSKLPTLMGALGDENTQVTFHYNAVSNPVNPDTNGNTNGSTGNNSTDTGNNSTNTGNNSTDTGNNSTNIGNNSTDTGNNSTNIGNNSTDTGNNSTDTGNNSTDTGKNDSNGDGKTDTDGNKDNTNLGGKNPAGTSTKADAKNDKVLPQTGEQSSYLPTLTGLGLLLSGVLGFFYKRKRS